jgi:hypothetical protein
MEGVLMTYRPSKLAELPKTKTAARHGRTARQGKHRAGGDGPAGCLSDADLQAVRTVGLTHGTNGMNNWLRSCYALTSQLAGSLVHSLATVTVAVILLGSMALAQSAPGSGWEVSANELARKVVANELKFQDEDHAQWMYRQEKKNLEETSREIRGDKGRLSQSTPVY